MSKRAQPVLVGTFVVVGLGAILSLALLFGSGALSRETLTLVSFFDGDVTGLRVGAPVAFRGVTLGSVSDVLLSLPDDPRDRTTDVRIAVLYDVDMGRFRAMSPGAERDLTDPAEFEAIVQAGLRAGLKTSNLLAGVKSIDLDIRPEVPDTRLNAADLAYREVPTMPSPFAAAQAQLEELATKVAGLPLDSIALNVNGLVIELRGALSSEEGPALLANAGQTLEAFTETAAEISAFMSTFEENVAPVAEELDRTFAETRAVMESLNATLAQIRHDTGPDGPFTFRTLQLLEETELMLKSLRDLIEYLNANPSAILKGRSGGGE
jgi:paraquat-inducible protein B